MARILSVSYDEPLLRTRELILRQHGYDVVSALGFTPALKQCEQSGNRFQLFILGHSIPHSDKEALIAAFRAHCRAPVVALTRRGERQVEGADFQIEPEPQQIVELVARLISGAANAAD